MSRKLQTIEIKGTNTRKSTSITIKATSYNEGREKVLKKLNVKRLPCGVKAQLEKIYK